MNTPHVIIACQGRPKCLEYALASLAEYSPRTPVHVVPIEGGSVQAFNEIYRHHSPNPEYFERLCFGRWFAISDFLVAHPEINRFWCLDIDVLTFCDLEAEAETCTRDNVPLHTWFCEDCGVLDYWTRKIWSLFKDQFDVFAATEPVVSDMTLARSLLDSTKPNMLTLRDGKQFDHNLALSGGCAMEPTPHGEVKSIGFNKGVPYAYHPEGAVRMLTLHFWGHLKPLMPTYLRRARESKGTI